MRSLYIICATFAYASAHRLHYFVQFNACVDMFCCIKSCFKNILLTFRYNKLLLGRYDTVNSHALSVIPGLSLWQKAKRGSQEMCCNSKYVSKWGLKWARSHSLGSDTRVACNRWTVHSGAEVPGSNPGVNPFFDPSLSKGIYCF